jgi:hypothetical protein
MLETILLGGSAAVSDLALDAGEHVHLAHLFFFGLMKPRMTSSMITTLLGIPVYK